MAHHLHSFACPLLQNRFSSMCTARPDWLCITCCCWRKPKPWHALTCEVDAVGMGATSRELRRPCLAMLDRRPGQSHRSLGGLTPHRSCCSCPWLAGLPSYVSYVPVHADGLLSWPVRGLGCVCAHMLSSNVHSGQVGATC